MRSSLLCWLLLPALLLELVQRGSNHVLHACHGCLAIEARHLHRLWRCACMAHTETISVGQQQLLERMLASGIAPLQACHRHIHEPAIAIA